MTVFPASPSKRLIGAAYIEDDAARAADIRARLKYLPEEAIIGLEKNAVPYAIKAKPYLAIRQQMIQILFGDHYSPREIQNRMIATNQLAYKAYLLFGTTNHLDEFVKKNLEKNAVHRNARNTMLCFQFPEASQWAHINFREWGNALLQQPSEQCRTLFLHHSAHLNPEKNSDGSISLLKTAFRGAMHSQTKLHEPQKLEKIFELAVRFDKNLDEFNRVLIAADTPKKVSPVLEWQELPDIVLQGETFGMPDCVFQKVSRHDPRLLYIGDYDDSCERVSDSPANMENTVIAATKTNRHAYYAVKCYGEIIAHSLAYRGKNRELVFDGFESKKENFNAYNLRCLLDALKEALDQKYGPSHEADCNGIILGVCKDHFEPLRETLPSYAYTLIQPKYMHGVGMTQKCMSVVQWPDERACYRREYLALQKHAKKAEAEQRQAHLDRQYQMLKNEI